jgi:F1F0 ATPase subunit 2
MSQQSSLLAALAAGLILGLFVFAGLGWTLRRGLASSNPALWLGVSALVRLAVVLVIFYYMALAGLPKVGLCLLGLLLARSTVTRRLRSMAGGQPCA